MVIKLTWRKCCTFVLNRPYYRCVQYSAETSTLSEKCDSRLQARDITEQKDKDSQNFEKVWYIHNQGYNITWNKWKGTIESSPLLSVQHNLRGLWYGCLRT